MIIISALHELYTHARTQTGGGVALLVVCSRSVPVCPDAIEVAVGLPHRLVILLRYIAKRMAVSERATITRATRGVGKRFRAVQMICAHNFVKHPVRRVAACEPEGRARLCALEIRLLLVDFAVPIVEVV